MLVPGGVQDSGRVRCGRWLWWNGVPVKVSDRDGSELVRSGGEFIVLGDGFG